ncbi:MAG: bifunctional transaldolase/phosoglucose isomerase [Anaerolineales bacterium]|nr:bifunctional transaldolase/phosoglucose isomerase [Anaerolineales bacterium]
MTYNLWYNEFSRDLIRSGAMERLIRQGIIGFTANPTVLERAIGEGTAYDDDLGTLLESESLTALRRLLTDDLQAAADLLRPLYESSEGRGGFVCVDLPPTHTERPETLLSEAIRVFRGVNRPNLMITILGKPTNLTAIEEALFSGVNIHISGVFSLRGYVHVAECYIRALERRALAGENVREVASVVQVDLARVEGLVNHSLENSIRMAQSRADIHRTTLYSALLGKVAAANARRAYDRFQEFFYGERFARLREAGAHIQPILWGAVDPNAPTIAKTEYLNMVGSADTYILTTRQTLDAFAAHPPPPEIPALDMPTAAETLKRAEELEIDLELIARRLQGDEEELFGDAFRKLITRVDGKRKTLMSGFMKRQSLVLGVYQGLVESAMKRLRGQLSITRTWARDPLLWKPSPDDAEALSNRLAWLFLPTDGRTDVQRMVALRNELRAEGITHILLIGMGGSILTGETLWEIFGSQPDAPELVILDTNDPIAIAKAERKLDMVTTCVVVSSRSGKAIETLALLRYVVAKFPEGGAGAHLIAITEAGSPLETEARRLGAREIFLCPPHLVGAYAALSYYGLLPAALCGIDVQGVLSAGAEMQTACAAGVMGNNHPGLWLGALMGTMALQGRDKLALLAAPEIAPLCLWIEPLIAEGLGKDGKSVIPVVAPTPGMPHDYDDDRLFVYLRLENSTENPDESAQRLREAGHPMVTLTLRDRTDVGAEFFRWQFATVVAAMVLGVNPFATPNVDESRRLIHRLLDDYATTRTLPKHAPQQTEGGLRLIAEEGMGRLLRDLAAQRAYRGSALVGALAAFFSLARSGDYVVFMPFFNPDVAQTATLNDIQRRARHVLKRAVMVNIFPRSLHTVGQMHKGGSGKGVFVQLTTDTAPDIAIPGERYTFGVLRAVQADGDFEIFQNQGMRIIRLHCGKDVSAGLRAIEAAIDALAEKQQ